MAMTMTSGLAALLFGSLVVAARGGAATPGVPAVDAPKAPAPAAESAPASMPAVGAPGPTAAPESAPAGAPAAPAAPTGLSLGPLRVHGFVDAYYDFNFNQPANGENFFPGVGSTPKRHDQIGLNLAALELLVDPKPVGAHLVLYAGSSTDVIHAGEPAGGVGSGADLWRFIGIATVSAVAPLGRGLLFELGIQPCHAGLESFWTKDNWNYTHSWMAELSPYYQTGLKTAYAITDHLSVSAHVMNGWQIIGENNAGKTFGTQLAWSSDLVSASWNTLFGPELPGDAAHWRVFDDFVLSVHPLDWLAFAATFDFAWQDQPVGDDAWWWAGAVYARVSPRPWGALAVRAEYFDDRDGAISGTAQRLLEGTVTVELRPWEHLILKVEGRYDHSTAPVFFSDRLDAAGVPELVQNQGLVTLGAVAIL
jgi:hypothetical protein